MQSLFLLEKGGDMDGFILLQFAEMCGNMLLKDEYKRLQYLLSDQSLQLLPEYQQRIKVCVMTLDNDDNDSFIRGHSHYFNYQFCQNTSRESRSALWGNLSIEDTNIILIINSARIPAEN
jgi:hypothetical protein